MRHRQYNGITSYGLMALGREMIGYISSSRSMAHFTFTFCLCSEPYLLNTGQTLQTPTAAKYHFNHC